MLVFVVLGAAAGGAFARASVVGRNAVRLTPANQVVLRSSFHRMGGVTGVAASGDYLLLSKKADESPPFAQIRWTVINQRTGATSALEPQCQLVGLGPPWVLMLCPSKSTPAGPDDTELYSLTNGTQQTVTPIPDVPYCPLSFGPADTANQTECSTPDAVGADWIMWDTTCYNCAVTYYFQNIQTGEVRHDPTNATTYADMNSPTLAHKTCPGVRPRSGDSLTFDGQFALATDSNQDVYLERCGTHMRRLLVNGLTVETYAMTWNARVMVWQGAVDGRLNGLFLPTYRRSRSRFPRRS